MTRAIILAAGQGTRLLPHTANRPKCLIPLLGQSILSRQLHIVRMLGINDITIAAGYRHEDISNLNCNCKVIVNPEFATTNMVATLFCARNLMRGNVDLIISYGDIVYERALLAAILDSDAPINIAIDLQWRRYWEHRMNNPLADAETLKMDAGGRLLEIGKKPSFYTEIEGQFIGLIKICANYLLEFERAYDLIDRNMTFEGRPRQLMYMTDFLQHLIEQGWHLQAVPVKNGWLEVDTAADLDLYHRMASDGTLSTFFKSE